MIDNATNEEYIKCSITIDGETLNNVAIRPKGNTSLSNVRSMDSERYSFKVEFDHYDDGINYKGLDKLALNNVIQDNTYIKDYLSYRIMQEAGAASPLCSFAYINVNGEEWGLYLAIEGIEESFAKRVYGNDYGEIYKPDNMNMGDKDEGVGNRQMPTAEPPKRPGNMDDGNRLNPSQQGNGEKSFVQEERQFPRDGDAAALIYQDENEDSYSVIFDSAVFNPDSTDRQNVINALKSLSEGDLENAVDTEALVRYFVAHNFVINFDSYTGNMLHNYYLYEDEGKLSMIPWDYNLAFGSFGGMDGSSGIPSANSATQYVNFPIDTPVLGTTLEQRPMIGKLLENGDAKEQYHKVFRQLIDDYFISGNFEREFNRVFEIITEYVQKDPTKFCTFDEFVRGAETLKEFCLLRAQSIDGQLNGTIPATSNGHSADDTAFIDASHINISDTGSMGFGNRERFPAQENMERVFPRIPQGENIYSSVPHNGKEEISVFDENKQLNPGDFEGFRGGQVFDTQMTTRTSDASGIIVLAASGIILIFGLVFVFAYKKKG